MKFEALWNFLEENVFTVKSTANLFNMYKDIERSVDLRNGSAIRRENLRAYISSFRSRAKVLLVGEAPGHKGCRFSGVPFTSEAQFCEGVLPFSGQKSSSFPHPAREATATIFWGIMQAYHPKFIVWNSIPFHPYKAGSVRSNRPPRNLEIENYLEILEGVLSTVDPVSVIAVGKRAEKALKLLGVDFDTARHPSRGGAKDFEMAVKKVLSKT
jgi:uracil-DNA glycosylase